MELSGLNQSIQGRLDTARSSLEARDLQRAVGARTPKEAGAKFEAMLGTMLARELRKGLDEGFFGSGPGAETFSSWLDEHIGRAMAERGTLGAGKLVEKFAADVAAAQAAQAAAEAADADVKPEVAP
jgi:hypothetical protein